MVSWGLSIYLCFNTLLNTFYGLHYNVGSVSFLLRNNGSYCHSFFIVMFQENSRHRQNKWGDGCLASCVGDMVFLPWHKSLPSKLVPLNSMGFHPEQVLIGNAIRIAQDKFTENWLMFIWQQATFLFALFHYYCNYPEQKYFLKKIIQ